MTSRPTSASVSASASVDARGSSVSVSLTSEVQALAFFESLLEVLPPHSVSDRTCYRRLADWLADGVAARRFPEAIFPRVLRYAREATVGAARNPRAVFLSILRKEIGYVPKPR